MRDLLKLFLLLGVCFAAISIVGCRAGSNKVFVPVSGSPTPNAAGEPPQSQTYNRDLDDQRKRIAGRVVHISDGDTFILEDELRKRTTVRIHAIDAPELAQPFGRESREQLRALIMNQQVEVREQNRDQFKRIVGAVFFNGRDMGLEMVRGGYVWHFKQYQKQQSPEDRAAYASAEEAAKNSRLGLWNDRNPVAPQDYRRKYGTR